MTPDAIDSHHRPYMAQVSFVCLLSYIDKLVIISIIIFIDKLDIMILYGYYDFHLSVKQYHCKNKIMLTLKNKNIQDTLSRGFSHHDSISFYQYKPYIRFYVFLNNF